LTANNKGGEKKDSRSTRPLRKIQVVVKGECLEAWSKKYSLKDQCVEAFMDRLPDWRDKHKTEKWGLHWWDAAFLNSKQQKRAAMREKLTVEAEEFQGLIGALDEYDDTMLISPKLLRSVCLWATKERGRESGQQLYELVTTTFFLTYWVTVPSYQVKALRDVVVFERDQLRHREQV